jgi:hypothetical protein
MINGDANEFLDKAYTGQDLIYIYHGIKYWFQGYSDENGVKHMEVVQYKPASEGYIWEHDDQSMENCLSAFVEAPIFDGKRFWDVEQEIEWVDD